MLYENLKKAIGYSGVRRHCMENSIEPIISLEKENHVTTVLVEHDDVHILHILNHYSAKGNLPNVYHNETYIHTSHMRGNE
jgi:hypothetical protein